MGRNSILASSFLGGNLSEKFMGNRPVHLAGDVFALALLIRVSGYRFRASGVVGLALGQRRRPTTAVAACESAGGFLSRSWTE
jgi:hypothetical protein